MTILIATAIWIYFIVDFIKEKKYKEGVTIFQFILWTFLFGLVYFA